MAAIIYEKATGQILRTVLTPDPKLAALQVKNYPDLGVVIGEGGDDTHYVVDGALMSRPTIAVPRTELVADDQDEITFLVPAGTTVAIDGEEQGVIDDGSFIFASAMPATYELVLTPPWPCLPLEVEIVAHAPVSQ